MNKPSKKTNEEPKLKLVSKGKLAIMLCWIPLGIAFNAYLTLERGGELNGRWMMAAGAAALLAAVVILSLAWYANQPDDE